MKERPTIPRASIWPRFEAAILEVVTRALRMLRDDPSLPEVENDINRRLCQYIHKAAHQGRQINTSFIVPAIMEAYNQPNLSDAERSPHEYKRPDFQWTMYDDQEPDLDKYVKRYIIECKRLGQRDIQKPYVTKGILRFISQEHRYAESSPSGAMIGYVQNMELNDILNEVNTFAEDNSVPRIEIVDDDWKEKDVSRLEHRLDRPQVLPTLFDLRHLWMDLRK